MDTHIADGDLSMEDIIEPIEEDDEWIDPVTLILGKILSDDMEDDDG